RLDDSLTELPVTPEDVTVNFLEALDGQSIDSRIEIVQVGHQISERVPDLPVRLNRARKHFLAEANLLREIAHRNPQTQDVGAAGLDDFLRLDRVPERLRHLPPVVGDDEAVR